MIQETEYQIEMKCLDIFFFHIYLINTFVIMLHTHQASFMILSSPLNSLVVFNLSLSFLVSMILSRLPLLSTNISSLEIVSPSLTLQKYSQTTILEFTGTVNLA